MSVGYFLLIGIKTIHSTSFATSQLMHNSNRNNITACYISSNKPLDAAVN